MGSGILLTLLGALSFGFLGCVSKVAERRNCNASALVVWVMGWACLISLVISCASHAPSHLTPRVVALASACGICAAIAYLAFQSSIKTGKVTLGWLMMNLSAGVPAAVSIWLYKEKVTPIKLLAFVLAVLALVMLFYGSRFEKQQTSAVEAE